MQRRRFIKGVAGAACAASGVTSCNRAASMTGSILGQAHQIGHQIRDRKSAWPAGLQRERTEVVIAGAGMSGLIAALRLHQAGIQKITLLDLEGYAGGHSSSGKNAVSPYPWGAHYVPLPGDDLVEVIRLFEELGIITGRDAASRPIFDDRYLCNDPGERLYIQGVWQEGLAPTLGADKKELDELHAFAERMHDLKGRRGNDGRRLFSIPVDESSTDQEWCELDHLSMHEWMIKEGYQSPRLHWLVDYSCRDDYGAGSREVSAWAGLHYFASRDNEEVLTWPEGNGWLVKQILKKMPGITVRHALVHGMSNTGSGVEVSSIDLASGEPFSLHAKATICAMPRFVAQRLIQGLPLLTGLQYSPWVVANLTWNAPPPAAWDNVLYNHRSLGYVVATHQALNQPFPKQSVLTWYQPRDHLAPALARQEMLDYTWEKWRDEILNDMRPAHPDIDELVTQLDVMLWGHGMIRPVPGFITGKERASMQHPHGKIVFAHTDMSGISIFEEACARGSSAASTILSLLHHSQSG